MNENQTFSELKMNSEELNSERPDNKLDNDTLKDNRIKARNIFDTKYSSFKRVDGNFQFDTKDRDGNQVRVLFTPNRN